MVKTRERIEVGVKRVSGSHGCILRYADGPTWLYLDNGTNNWRLQAATEILGPPYQKWKTEARWKDPQLEPHMATIWTLLEPSPDRQAWVPGLACECGQGKTSMCAGCLQGSLERSPRHRK